MCFNKNAEVAEKYLHSGARIAVVGYLNQSKWKTNDGENRSSFEMIVNSIELIKTDDGKFFVESGEGKILYSVTINDAGDTCTWW